MNRGVLERGIHKVIRTQGIPVNAVVKVCNGKGLLIRGYRRTASAYRSESVGNGKKWLSLHFARARVDAPIDLKGRQIPRTTHS